MISDDCFFLVIDSRLICWDFQNHKQYELSAAHARRLVSLVYDASALQPSNVLDQDFIQCGLIRGGDRCAVPWGWDVLSRIYHFGTKNIPLDNEPHTVEEWAKSYLSHCDDVWSRARPTEVAGCDVGGIFLARWQAVDPFEKVLRKRSTVRAFTDKSVSFEILGRLLQYTLGFIDERELPDGCGLPEKFRKRRSSPSGGGLNSTEGYVFIQNVEGINPGVYYYEPHSHALHLRSSDFPSVGSMFSGQHFANNIPVGLFLTSRFDRLWWKYEHSRAYRMALLEVGHVAQTFQLMATALGLGTWPTGALTEEGIEPLLKLSGCSEQVLFFVGCGYSSGAVTPEALKTLVGQQSK